MSNYREDTLEIVVAKDHCFTVSKSITEERIYAKESSRYGLKFLTTDQVYAADQVRGQKGYVTVETVHAADIDQSKKIAQLWLTEKAKARSSSLSKLNVLTIETVVAQDLGRYILKTKQLEKVYCVDQAKFTTRSFLTEKAILKDRTKAIFSDFTQDTVYANDLTLERLLAVTYTLEQVTAVDYDNSKPSSSQFTVESIQARDQVWNKLYALQKIQEIVFADDVLVIDGQQSQVWTAHTDTWAMSRYAPFNFDGAAVINDHLYFYRDDGVYQYGIEGEVIDASIQTAPLDFGEALVHPLAYFMEYSLSGAAKKLDIGVTTTQSGTSQRYVYTLAKETADMLTNGRVQFGRGLRGRHFAFDIQLHGTAAALNAQSVDFSQTARRI